MCVRRVHITTHSDDQKLEGFQSLSTSVVVNPICQARRLVNSTCAKCYAESILRYRKNLDAFLVDNFDVLNSVMSDEEINAVQFSTVYARIESFGDVASQLQAYNYTRIIRANGNTHFGIWSKNYAYWFRVFDAIGKPVNCTFVLSSPNVNEVFDINRIPEKWRGYIDHVFTVWDPEKYPLDAESMEGHCAGVKCRTCLKCYRAGGPFYINEALRTQTKVNKLGREQLAKIIAEMGF